MEKLLAPFLLLQNLKVYSGNTANFLSKNSILVNSWDVYIYLGLGFAIIAVIAFLIFYLFHKGE